MASDDFLLIYCPLELSAQAGRLCSGGPAGARQCRSRLLEAARQLANRQTFNWPEQPAAGPKQRTRVPAPVGCEGARLSAWRAFNMKIEINELGLAGRKHAARCAPAKRPTGRG